jgi:cell division initiation protein
MAITPIDIQQHQFKTRPLGYEKTGVDHFLELVADELERLHKQSQEFKEELSRTRTSLEDMRSREATLKETLLTTQKMTDEMKAVARREAEIVLAEAQLKAERIVRDAEERRIQLIGEIQEIKRQKISFETSLRVLVESHMRMLDLEVVSMEGGRDNRLLEEPLPFDEETRVVNDDDFEEEP